MRFVLTPILSMLVGAGVVCAADIAVLDNGSRLTAERVERDGDRVILHTGGGGRIELDATRVASIEHIDEPVVPTPTPVAAQPSAPPTPTTPNKEAVRAMVTEAALRYGLPPELVHGVAQAESAYQPQATSVKGARGVMQLMPATAKRFDADASDVRQNIDAGARLLRTLLERYQDAPNPVSRALAAYNAGEGAVERYHGIPPYRETLGYIERVLGFYWKNMRANPAGN